jgi:hypothetical protein
MPYNCENCKESGARMNSIFKIRLCNICFNSYKYRLICKSKAQSQYLLLKSDFNNNNYRVFIVLVNCLIL